MTVDIEGRLRGEAIRVADAIGERGIPDWQPKIAPRRRRAGVALVAAAAVSVVAAALALTRVDDRKSISSATTPSDPTPVDVVSTVGSTVPAATTTSLPGVSSTDAPADRRGVPLDVGAAQGLVAALDPIPDGYRIANVMDGGGSGGSPGVVWYATYLQMPVESGRLADYVQAQISDITGRDPYEGFPGLTERPDAVVGTFTGKWYDLTGYSHGPTFVAILDNSRRLVVSGRTTTDVVATIAAGLVERTDAVGFDATVTPDGYQLIDEGPGVEASADIETWLTYAKGQSQSTAITIRTLIRPTKPAVTKFVGPLAPRLADIDGTVAVIGFGTLTMDVTPTYQVEIAIDYTNPNDTRDAELIEIARQLVAIDAGQLEALRAHAAAEPLVAADLPCPNYISMSNPRTGDLATNAEGIQTAHAPGAITVDIRASQPVESVTIYLRSAADMTLVQVAQLPLLDAAAVTIDLVWDGTIDGAPAPTGDYTVFVFDASPPPGSGPDACQPSQLGSYTSSFGFGFNVP